jgi:hypothetical protein
MIKSFLENVVKQGAVDLCMVTEADVGTGRALCSWRADSGRTIRVKYSLDVLEMAEACLFESFNALHRGLFEKVDIDTFSSGEDYATATEIIEYQTYHETWSMIANFLGEEANEVFFKNLLFLGSESYGKIRSEFSSRGVPITAQTIRTCLLEKAKENEREPLAEYLVNVKKAGHFDIYVGQWQKHQSDKEKYRDEARIRALEEELAGLQFKMKQMMGGEREAWGCVGQASEGQCGKVGPAAAAALTPTYQHVQHRIDPSVAPVSLDPAKESQEKEHLGL